MTRETMIELGYLPKPFITNHMKLKFYNPETTVDPKRSPESHLVIRKSGSVCFTKPAEKQLGLKLGTKIEFCQNEENQDWYLFKSDKGFILKSMGQQLGISCKKMSELLWLKKAEGEKSVKMIISQTPMNYNGVDYFLLTCGKKK